MKKSCSSLFVKFAAALALAAPMLASAESQLVTGARAEAVARLNFQVKIPRVLFLGVGTGNARPLATDGTIDTLTFDYTNNPLAVGTGAPAASITNTGPDGAIVPVRVFGNDGQITITATNPVSLTSGTDNIPFTEMAMSSDKTDLAAPAFGGGTSMPTLNGHVTNQTASWTYSFANTTVLAAGTYSGQVTYTAAMP